MAEAKRWTMVCTVGDCQLPADIWTKICPMHEHAPQLLKAAEMAALRLEVTMRRGRKGDGPTLAILQMTIAEAKRKVEGGLI